MCAKEVVQRRMINWSLTARAKSQQVLQYSPGSCAEAKREVATPSKQKDTVASKRALPLLEYLAAAAQHAKARLGPASQDEHLTRLSG